LFSDSFRTEESDDIHAALALMYGYAAKYAPSTVIEARINALVVGHLFSLLLTRYLYNNLYFVVLLYFLPDTKGIKIAVFGVFCLNAVLIYQIQKELL